MEIKFLEKVKLVDVTPLIMASLNIKIVCVDETFLIKNIYVLQHVVRNVIHCTRCR